MDNKTTINNNNTTISNHNTDLITILNTINDLPEITEPIVETWIFTMEDGSTVTKEVVVE